MFGTRCEVFGMKYRVGYLIPLLKQSLLGLFSEADKNCTQPTHHPFHPKPSAPATCTSGRNGLFRHVRASSSSLLLSFSLRPRTRRRGAKKVEKSFAFWARSSTPSSSYTPKSMVHFRRWLTLFVVLLWRGRRSRTKWLES